MRVIIIYYLNVWLRILTQIQQFVSNYRANYVPCAAAVRDGVDGKPCTSSDLPPLTNSAFTTVSFGNSNFTDGLPVCHKSATN